MALTLAVFVWQPTLESPRLACPLRACFVHRTVPYPLPFCDSLFPFAVKRGERFLALLATGYPIVRRRVPNIGFRRRAPKAQTVAECLTVEVRHLGSAERRATAEVLLGGFVHSVNLKAVFVNSRH